MPGIKANGEYFKSDAVFVGTVLSTRIKSDTEKDLGGWFYRLRVHETFRGIPNKEAVVFTENSDVRFPLEIGNEYLLFARGGRNGLEVDSCGNSSKISEAVDSLTRLKSLRGRTQPSEIEGWIVGGTTTDVSGIVVTLRRGGTIYSATTNKDGWFGLPAPPGTYRVDFSSNAYRPNGDDEFWYGPKSFRLHRGECASLQFVSVRP